MFRHLGQTRTLKHNLRVASLLSFVAGIVNSAGFLAVQYLTTNVTGHFAFLVENLLSQNLLQASIYLLYVFCFFFGSFVSNTVVEIVSSKNEKYIYIAPVILEIIVLSITPIWRLLVIEYHAEIVACSLLFAMGLQNSLVTSISNALVRTTHLTGLFTDLGIELSQLLFYRTLEQLEKLRSTIRLRLTIIVCFFVGGITGGLIYFFIYIKVLWIASIVLIFGLAYDSKKFRQSIRK